jgi:hypothetical protein
LSADSPEPRRPGPCGSDDPDPVVVGSLVGVVYVVDQLSNVHHRLQCIGQGLDAMLQEIEGRYWQRADWPARLPAMPSETETLALQLVCAFRWRSIAAQPTMIKRRSPELCRPRPTSKGKRELNCVQTASFLSNLY